MTNEELVKILADHVVYLKTKGDKGKRAKFEGMNLTDLRLDGSNLKGADFSGATLFGASFVGANLQGAVFESSDLKSVAFNDADLFGSSFEDAKGYLVSFSGARLTNSSFDKSVFTRCDFSKIQCVKGSFAAADLAGSSFSQANLLLASFESANLERAKFSRATLSDCMFLNLNADEAEFRQVTFDKKTNFAGSRLRSADFSESSGDPDFEKSDLFRAYFRNVNFSGSSFRECDLQNSSFTGSRLGSCDFTNAYLRRSEWYSVEAVSRCMFMGARFEQAKIGGAAFEECLMMAAKFDEVSLGNTKQVTFGGSILTRASFVGASLKNALFPRTVCDGAQFGNADLKMASFAQASLVQADFSGAELNHASFADADIRMANFEGAALSNANFDSASGVESANFKKTVYEDVFRPQALTAMIATGKQTRALSKLKAQPLPLKAGAFKKLFPLEFEKVKDATKGADFTPELLQRLIEKYGVVWSVSADRYAGEGQRLCEKANEVLLLNIDMSDAVYTEQQKKNLKAVREVSKRSGHPVAMGPDAFTVGWVRYCEFPDRILVEEVQSDVPGVRKGLKDPDFRSRLEKAGVSPDELEETLSLLAPFADRFYEDALGLVFDMAEGQAKKVEMFDYAQKKQFGSPRNVYTDLPKSMGMKLGPSEAMPEVGQVWTYTPNRKRRTR